MFLALPISAGMILVFWVFCSRIGLGKILGDLPAFPVIIIMMVAFSMFLLGLSYSIPRPTPCRFDNAAQGICPVHCSCKELPFGAEKD